MGPDELERQARLEDTHFWYAARRRQVVARLPAPTSSSSWALDLGAGSGGNTSVLTQAGYRAVALEHHGVAAGFAKGRGLSVVRGDAHALPYADASFDLVLACDVLEHLVDDRRAVSEIRRVLRPGGTLLCTVPADPRLWSAHDVALHHHRRYTRESLSTLLNGGGLPVQTLDAWMVLLRPLVAVRRALSSRRAEVAEVTDDPVSDLEELPGVVNGVFRLVMRCEHAFTWLRGRTRGVSLIALARRE